ncbi:hypothetical protein EVAR_32628_1 [Eumeta japonica]|uniref:Uncharacterized protein n=1 Tax=Eumeta variegata TaxID=151549 RepID=A0A4C1WH30_EUMVA|nr:hypothetical protein EVAR_32628_1 [Eumeta japonica]
MQKDFERLPKGNTNLGLGRRWGQRGRWGRPGIWGLKVQVCCARLVGLTGVSDGSARCLCLRVRRCSIREGPAVGHFRPIESGRPGSENLSSFGSRTIERATLYFDIDSGPANGRRYLATLSDYSQRSTALPS